LKSMLEEAKMTKPVFTFTLGWQMGHQHGQDPAMFVDAGVNFNHIMLYEGDRNTLASMKRQWPDYLSRGVGMFWHDLYRMIYGIRGPYSTMEWLVSGGKAFSSMQQAQGLSPIEVAVVAPKEIPGGVPVPISVVVRNHSPENLKGVVLHQIDTTKDYYVDLAT